MTNVNYEISSVRRFGGIRGLMSAYFKVVVKVRNEKRTRVKNYSFLVSIFNMDNKYLNDSCKQLAIEQFMDKNFLVNGFDDVEGLEKFQQECYKTYDKYEQIDDKAEVDRWAKIFEDIK